MTAEKLRLKVIDRILRVETVEELEKIDRYSLDAICREVEKENKVQSLFNKVKDNADFAIWAEEQLGVK